MLLCGLLLYSVNVGLQVSIGAYYLGMRECYRGITMEYDNFNLANALGQNPSKFTTTTPVPTTVSIASIGGRNIRFGRLCDFCSFELDNKIETRERKLRK